MWINNYTILLYCIHKNVINLIGDAKQAAVIEFSLVEYIVPFCVALTIFGLLHALVGHFLFISDWINN